MSVDNVKKNDKLSEVSIFKETDESVVELNKEDSNLKLVKEILPQANDLTNSVDSVLGKVSDLANTFTRVKEIESATMIKSQRILFEHNQVMRNMDRYYNNQEKALDKTFDVIDAGLESGDLSIVKAGIDGMLGTIENKFKSDKLSEIESNMIVSDADDDLDSI